MGKDDHALDTELVPLSVAAMVACRHLRDPWSEIEQAASLPRVLGRAALAVAEVAPIQWRESGGLARPMSAQELRRLLTEPMLDETRRPNLDRFLVRRADLRAALVRLRQARDPLVA